MLQLPPIPNPTALAGLYVFDFGEHVSVGYTASEIAVLWNDPEHRNGSAYEVYRVDAGGALELRGVRRDHLRLIDTLCLLRTEPADAARDYQQIRERAKFAPPRVSIELKLAKCYAFDPPHVTALVFSAVAGMILSTWLDRIEFHGGDHVVGGQKALSDLASSGTMTIMTCDLEVANEYRDREADEVLRNVYRPLQRSILSNTDLDGR